MMYSFPSLPFLLHSPHYCVMDGLHVCPWSRAAWHGERPSKGAFHRYTSDLAGMGILPEAVLADHAATDFTDAPPGDTAMERTGRGQSCFGVPPLPIASFQNFPTDRLLLLASFHTLLCSTCSARPQSQGPAPRRPRLDPLGSAARPQNCPVSEEGSPCSAPPAAAPRSAPLPGAGLAPAASLCPRRCERGSGSTPAKSLP